MAWGWRVEPAGRREDRGPARIVAAVGAGLLSPCAEGEPGNTGQAIRNQVTSVVLHDPADPPAVTPGAFVLGVGLTGPQDTVAAIRAFGRNGAVALAVREPVPSGPAIRAALDDTPLTLYGLARGVPWLRVADLVSAALDVPVPGQELIQVEKWPQGQGHGQESGSGPARVHQPAPAAGPVLDGVGADLFDVANTLAALLDAPVTIEDVSSRVVAFSAGQTGADEDRRRTVLGLRQPDDIGASQRRHGVLARVHASDRPVYIADVVPGALPRVAVRVRAGDEALGTIWAVVREPLDEQRERGMAQAAHVVALAMLRARLSADELTRMRRGLVLGLLDGGSQARRTARQLDFAGRPACVVAMGAPTAADTDSSADPSAGVAALHRVANAWAMYLEAVCPQAVSALVGSVVYAVLPLRGADGGRGASGARAADGVRLAGEFLERVGTPNPCFAGVGSVVADPGDLAFSRTAADAALRVLCRRGLRGRPVAATLEDVQTEHILLRVADVLADERVEVGGPLRTLRAYDAEHDTALVETVRAWLDAFGDTGQAARAVRVHKNTFRYRVTRLQEIAGIDLADPEQRFALALQLRVFPSL